MNDEAILDLYFSRDEQAIAETDAAYGRSLLSLSRQILEDIRDAEESVSDTYLKTWDRIPPQRPGHFFGYLAKLCRFSATDKLDWNRAAKRGANLVSLTQEMEACIPDRRREQELEARELGAILSRFLKGLPQEPRLIFLRRYWYADSIASIAARYGLGESKVKTTLHRTRNKLKDYLAQEGITV